MNASAMLQALAGVDPAPLFAGSLLPYLAFLWFAWRSRRFPPQALRGFALTLLQRRLASSPLAIARSLERRRKRLEARLSEVRRGLAPSFPVLEEEDIEEKEEFPDEELEDAPEVLDQATAARLRPADSQRVARAWERAAGTDRLHPNLAA